MNRSAPISNILLMRDESIDPIIKLIEGSMADTSVKDLSALAIQAAQDHRQFLNDVRKGSISEEGENSYPFPFENGVATIPVVGALTHTRTCMSYVYGGASYSEIISMANACYADDSITAVKVKFRTPGGEPDGMLEAGQALKRLSEKKQTIAYIDGMCCSAGFALAVNCSEIIASSEISDTCSIGVVAAIPDKSGTLEGSGIIYHKFVTGPQKGVGMAYSKIEPAQLERINEECQALGIVFQDLVNRERGAKLKAPVVLGKGFADGASYWAKHALEAGLIDGIMSAHELDEKMQAGESLSNGKEPVVMLDPVPLPIADIEEQLSSETIITPTEAEQALPLPETPEVKELTSTKERTTMPNAFSEFWDSLKGKSKSAAVLPDTFVALTAAAGFVLTEGATPDAELAAFQTFLSNRSAIVADGLTARTEAIEAAVQLANQAEGPGTIDDVAKASLLAQVDSTLLADVREKMADFGAKAKSTFAPIPSKPEVNGQATKSIDELAQELAASKAAKVEVVAEKTAAEIEAEYQKGLGGSW